jgi:hypoxanthine-DNA glycosylase
MPAETAAAARAGGLWQRGFEPVIAPPVRVLVLGSFPSPASLAARQYYAHPRNQFWPIMGAILDRPLAAMAYEERLCVLLDHGIGVWDVYAACRRRGSLDSAIEASRSNELNRLPLWAPGLRAVALNGRTAGRFAPGLSALGLVCQVLPSTSPAYAAMRLEDKLAPWKAFIQAWR